MWNPRRGGEPRPVEPRGVVEDSNGLARVTRPRWKLTKVQALAGSRCQAGSKIRRRSWETLPMRSR